MHAPHILIAGGGIGGLTAALALLDKGLDVDVYEQATERQRHARVRRARRRRGAEGPVVRGDRQGSAAVEHGRDLEAVRSWRRIDCAIRLSLLHGVPALSPLRTRLRRAPQ